jgi:hypothetical protein
LNVILESVSLSGYILERGGPVVPGKLKDMPENYEPIVLVDVKKLLLWERIKYQDFPMIVILVIHLISHMATGSIKTTGLDKDVKITELLFGSETIPLIQILLTLL